MEGQIVSCLLCQRTFRVPASFYERVHRSYHCDVCVEAAWILPQPHVLLLGAMSQTELEETCDHLLLVAPSSARGEMRFSRSSLRWSLDIWYEQIPPEMLILLASLHIHSYSLINLSLDEDSLTFWPDYEQPQGRLAPFLDRMITYEQSCNHQSKSHE